MPGTPGDYARDVTTRLSYAFKDAAVRSTAAKLNKKQQCDKNILSQVTLYFWMTQLKSRINREGHTKF